MYEAPAVVHLSAMWFYTAAAVCKTKDLARSEQLCGGTHQTPHDTLLSPHFTYNTIILQFLTFSDAVSFAITITVIYYFLFNFKLSPKI